MFNIHHTCISVGNLEESLNFYKKLGFEKFNEYHDDLVDIVLLRLNYNILIWKSFQIKIIKKITNFD